MAPTPEVTADDALRSAYHQYNDAGLRLPPIPRSLLGDFENFGPWHYGTRDCLAADRAALVAEAVDPDLGDYLTFSHVGHGTNSWAVALRMVLGPVAVFVRHPWGGAHRDSDVDGVAVHSSFHRLEGLLAGANAASASGRLGPSRRLVVVQDSQQGGGWQAPGEAWCPSADPIGAALAWLDGA